MAPEQAEGRLRAVGPAADVYALGAILYHCLTGQVPFRGSTDHETREMVLSREPKPPRQLNPAVPGDLETICLACLRKEPSERYATAADLAEDLRRFLDDQPILIQPPRWTDPVMRALRHRNLVARTAWGKINLITGPTGLLCHLALNGLVLMQPAKEVWSLSIGVFWLLNLYPYVHYLWPRRRELLPVERHILSVTGCYVLGTMVLWVALGAPYDRGILTTYYPASAVLIGLLYCVPAGVYWGRLYFLGLAYYALAVVMRFTPDWAALELGVLTVVGQGGVGWYLLRQADETPDGAGPD
jgi:serine/threonine-protein kinase